MGGIFGSSSLPKPPERDDEEIEARKRRELQAENLRRGRSSTILVGSTSGNTLAPAPTLLGA